MYRAARARDRQEVARKGGRLKPTTIIPWITLSAETVLALAATHISHFSEMINLGGRGVNVPECQYYRALWTEMRTVVSRGQQLGSEHLGELHDAVTSREYDGLLTSDELLSVLGSIARPTDCVVSETARAS